MQVTLAALAVLASTIPASAQKSRHQRPPAAEAALPCGDLLSFQVLLDRKGFSPGQIDGRNGANFARAVGAFQKDRGVAQSGKPDCETWSALGGNDGGDALARYDITEADANAEYVPSIPKDLNEQASLPALGYVSLLERLGERFHAAPALLQKLNPGATFGAGTTIAVPGVTPFDPATRPPAESASSADAAVLVTKEDSSLRVTTSDGATLFFAPVTTGSEHDPLPVGTWTVKGVQWLPPFHYNPDLFWDAKPGHTRAVIKPGPNNPAGVLWIALNLEHYGLHGTPEPGSVGHTASHGCVRLTNWDAARLAALIRPGSKVEFR